MRQMKRSVYVQKETKNVSNLWKSFEMNSVGELFLKHRVLRSLSTWNPFARDSLSYI